MTQAISRFSLPIKLRPVVSESDYAGLQYYIDAVVAVSKLTYRSFYIIDYAKMEFVYVSDNPLFLCGCSSDEVRKKGFDFYLEHIPNEDLHKFQLINLAVFNFYDRLPITDKLHYVISYNFHLGKFRKCIPILVHHQEVPLLLDRNGNIWMSICQVSLPPTKTEDEVIIKSTVSDASWRLNNNGQWIQNNDLKRLSEDEKCVIRLAGRGMSIKDIAETLHKSEAAIKKYRTSLFDKLQVTNITEAVAAALSRKLL